MFIHLEFMIYLFLEPLKLILSCIKMVREGKKEWKANYFVKIQSLLEEYPKCFIVGADNVGSKQMQVCINIEAFFDILYTLY
jgi:hypothetical protein